MDQDTDPKPVSQLQVALSPRDEVPLIAWGSQENSGAPEDLQTCVPSSAPSGSTDAAQDSASSSTNGSGTSSSLPAGDRAQLNLVDLDSHSSALSLISIAAEDTPGHDTRLRSRGQTGGHRSLPGVADLHPQEVIVKVQVQQRGYADSCTKQHQQQQACTQTKVQEDPLQLQQQQQQQQSQQLAQVEPQHEQQQQQEEAQQEVQDEPDHVVQQHQHILTADCPQQQPAWSDTPDMYAHQLHQRSSPVRDSRSSSPYSSSNLCSRPSHTRKRLLSIPLLDLSKAHIGKPVAKGPSEPQPLTRGQAERDAELCLEHGSSSRINLHPDAPMQDNRCYHYRAMGVKDVAAMQFLLSRLPPHDAAQVQDVWDALLMARRDCEAMAARGVRVSRDISRDWQETVSDLIDRVVAQDNELGQLRQQLKSAQAASSSGGVPGISSSLSTQQQHHHQHILTPGTGNSTNSSSMEDLHSQVVRLKRHRDRLMRDQQELSRELAETKLELQGAQVKATEAQDQLAYLHQQAQDLRDQHVTLLQQHIALAAYAEGLEAATACMQQQPATLVLGQCAQATPGLVAAAAIPGFALQPCMGLQGASRSSSVPLDWGNNKQQPQHQQLQLQQQPLAKLCTLQGSHGVLMGQQQPAATTGPHAVAASMAAAAVSSGTGASSIAAGAAKAASSSSRWLHASLSNWVHLGHSNKHTRGTTNSKHSGQVGPAMRVTHAGAAPAPAEVVTGADSCKHSSCGVLTDKSASPALCSGAATPLSMQAGQEGQLSRQAQLEAAVQQQLAHATAPERPGSAAAVRQTLEQATAAMAASLAAGTTQARRPGTRRFATACPRKVALSQQVLSSSEAGAVHAMCPVMSIDIPHTTSASDHTPRAGGHKAHQASKTAASHTPRQSGWISSRSGGVSTPSLMTAPEGSESGLQLVAPPSLDMQFDQADVPCMTAEV